MKQLATKNEALENMTSFIGSEISVELLFEHLETAITDLCRYKMTSPDFIGGTMEFDTIQVLISLKDTLLKETEG